MGHCLTHCAIRESDGSPDSIIETQVPLLRKQILKDMKIILGDSYFNRFKLTNKSLSRTELLRAFEFVELQMLLPRRYCVDTQVLVMTSAQLACCGMFVHQPFLNNQSCFVTSLSLHILFDPRSMAVEAYAVALATLARSLEGNANLLKLTINLMGIGFVERTARNVALFSAVLRSFAAMLCCNNTLRVLRFEGMTGDDEGLPWDPLDAEIVVKAQRYRAQIQRLAVLMARHSRSSDAWILARNLPNDILSKILDLAAPLRKGCMVHFDFCQDHVEALSVEAYRMP